MLERFLTHPFHPSWSLLRAVPWWVPALVLAAVLMAAVIWAGLRIRRARTCRHASRFAWRVVIRPAPGTADPRRAETFWLEMKTLLERRQYGWLPHVVWELRWSGDLLSISVWVPAVISAQKVRGVVESAWPGAVTSAIRPGRWPVLHAGGEVAGGQVGVVSGQDWLPLRTDHGTDQLSGVLASGVRVLPGDVIVAQVLARPATDGRRARARAGMLGKPRAAGAGGKALRALDMLLSGLLAVIDTLMSPHRHGTGARKAPAPDPAAEAKMREGTHWEIAVRYAVATDGRGKPAREHAGVSRDVLAAQFGAYSHKMRLYPARLRRPARAIERRRLKSGFLVTNGELAALAHLPWEPGTVAGLPPGGARPVPAPHGVRGVSDPWPR
jgi:hypothetical protein